MRACAAVAVLCASRAVAHGHGRIIPYGTKQDAIDIFVHRSRHADVRQRASQVFLGDSSLEPQQLRLSLTTDPAAMQITWITMSACAGSVVFWPAADPSQQASSAAQQSTYTAGLFGWSGSIHIATMSALSAGETYAYSVGCGQYNVSGSGQWSLPRRFKAATPASADANIYVAVTADFGTIQPLGWAVADQIIEEHTQTGPQPFDMSVIVGDLSYATIDPPNNEVEWSWDSFGMQNEPFTSTAPQMTVAGNHEHVPGNITDADGVMRADQFAAYNARYRTQPSSAAAGSDNLFYSFDFGPAHWVSLCTEIPYEAGSPQWAWLQADLAAANGRRNVTPWNIVMLHRPVYSADTDEYTAHSPGCPLSQALEPLFRAYGVDLVLQGHEHCWERSNAVYNGTVLQTGPNYVRPGAPVYIVAGASGAMQEEKFVTPTPAWSALALDGVYGFGRLTINGSSLLSMDFVDTAGQVHDTFTIAK